MIESLGSLALVVGALGVAGAIASLIADWDRRPTVGRRRRK